MHIHGVTFKMNWGSGAVQEAYSVVFVLERL